MGEAVAKTDALAGALDQASICDRERRPSDVDDAEGPA
jgi:hypothetical protein